MDTALVHILVGYILIICKTELVQNKPQSFCRREHHGTYTVEQFVSVCQNNSKSLRRPGTVIMLDPSGARRQQVIECKCYIHFDVDQSQLYSQVYIFMYSDRIRSETFEINERTYIDGSTMLNITSDTTITFRQESQDGHARLCMGIRKDDLRGSLTIRCEDNGHPMVSTTHKARTTIPTRSIFSATEMTSTLSTQPDKEDSMDIRSVILYTCISIGVVLLIGITACCAVRRKRMSANDVSKESTPEGNRKGEQTDRSAMENAAAPRTADGTQKADSEYAYVAHCNVTASDKCNSANATESGVYNHLNEVQPGPHSDNVYSTTHMHNTTKQVSGDMLKHEPMNNQSESDVYNHLNEVRPSPHSDNIYNATNVHTTATQETGASSSEYDSVELVNRRVHAQPDSDYNVLSFP